MGAETIDGYPTIILADEKGAMYGRTGFRGENAQDYIKNLQALKSLKVERDRVIADTRKKGLERAQSLAEIFDKEEQGLMFGEQKFKLLDEAIELASEDKSLQTKLINIKGNDLLAIDLATVSDYFMSGTDPHKTMMNNTVKKIEQLLKKYDYVTGGKAMVEAMTLAMFATLDKEKKAKLGYEFVKNEKYDVATRQAFGFSRFMWITLSAWGRNRTEIIFDELNSLDPDSDLAKKMQKIRKRYLDDNDPALSNNNSER
jgi:hypothetical protein